MAKKYNNKFTHLSLVWYELKSNLMANNNNFNDPLYIHPSDTPGINLVNDQLLGVDNYGVWSRAMLIALRAKNKIAFIDGSCPRPAAGSSTSLQWEGCNALVLSWIMNTVSKEIFGGVVYASGASAVWADLKEQFDKINGSQIFSLHHEIGRLTQGNNTISTYYCKLKQLWDEYSALVSLPSCACDVAKKYVEHDQQQKLLQFLMGLNDSYMHLRSQMLMMSPLSTVGQAFSLLSEEESHRSISVTEVPIAAFYTNQIRSGKPSTDKDKLHCDHCNWPGHTKEYCYKLVGYPSWHKLYKGPHTGSPHRLSKDIPRNKKTLGEANVVEGNKDVILPCESVDGAPLFSPAQYAEILKLLGSSTIQSDSTPTVNMAAKEAIWFWKENIMSTNNGFWSSGGVELLSFYLVWFWN